MRLLIEVSDRDVITPLLRESLKLQRKDMVHLCITDALGRGAATVSHVVVEPAPAAQKEGAK